MEGLNRQFGLPKQSRALGKLMALKLWARSSSTQLNYFYFIYTLANFVSENASLQFGPCCLAWEV